MEFISKYRRHKGALPILIMLALTGLGLTFSAATAAPAKNTMSASAKSTVIEEGKEIFLKGCSSCHGLNSEGGAVAPSLIGVGAASVDFQVGTGRMPWPKFDELNPMEVWNLYSRTRKRLFKETSA
jgi:ubiquinol-cytochrome c reductase cytochrome c subunit